MATGEREGLLGKEAMKKERGSKDGLMGQVWVRQLWSRCVIGVDLGTCTTVLKISRFGGAMRARKRGGASPNPTSPRRLFGREVRVQARRAPVS